MENIKISVVTVCYNAQACIEDTIKSVISQHYDDLEYIVIDGGSTDGTVDIVRKYIDKIAYYISEPDKGIYDAMNKAIKKTTGKYVNFLNAGDVFVNESVLSNIANCISSECDVLFGDIIVCKNGNYYIEKATEGEIKKPKSVRMGYNHQASFVRTALARKYPFDLNYKLAADFNMMKTLYHIGAKFFYCKFPVVIYDTTGVSSVNVSKHRYECLMIIDPARPLRNKLIAHFWGIKVKCKTNISNIIIKTCPFLLKRYYSNKKDYVAVNPSCQN